MSVSASRGRAPLAIAIAIAAGLAITAGRARGDGTVIVGGSPRSIGRAGTGTVGDDGAGALLLNPAALARRSDTRAQVGVGYIDDGIGWKGLGSGGEVVNNQIGSLAMPTLGIETGLGSWVVGLAAMTASLSDRQLRRPTGLSDFNDPNALLYRYTGLGGGVRRDTVTLGAARRIGDHAAVGVAIAGSRISIAETRRVWAGFSGITNVGDPSQDVQLDLEGQDWVAPSAVAGVLIAPEAPIELGASISYEPTAHISGTASGFGTAGGPFVYVTSSAATLDLPEPITARTGARYLADRFVIEVDGDLFVFPHGSTANAWQLAGFEVANNGVVAPVEKVTSRLAPQTHGAVRASIDVELIGGFLWATGGYAYTTAGTPAAELSPTLADMGGHTVGLGIEANAGGFTITVGVSRSWSGIVDVPNPQWQLDNPFGKGDMAVTAGEFAAVSTQVGILLDAQLDAPR